MLGNGLEMEWTNPVLINGKWTCCPCLQENTWLNMQQEGSSSPMRPELRGIVQQTVHAMSLHGAVHLAWRLKKPFPVFHDSGKGL